MSLEKMVFPPLKNDRILLAAQGLVPDKLPIWVMRQAGRYLPEFRELRRKYDFFTICRTPELACEATLQPIKRFNLDAAIIFSDILVIPQALGMVVEMTAGVGPVLPDPISVTSDLDKLVTPLIIKEKLSYVLDAITLTRKRLDGKVPLIGFTGAPWTLMSYMIEGRGTKTMSKARTWLYTNVNGSLKLLEILTEAIIDYLVEQVAAGAQLLQVFESHAEYLAPAEFEKFSLPSLRKIRQAVKIQLIERGLPHVPMIVYAKGANHSLEKLAESGYEVVSIDWTIDPEEARRRVGAQVTLQGNLDPVALRAPSDELVKKTNTMIEKFGCHRYIVNLGHGIYPEMDPESVNLFVETVHKTKITSS